MIYSTNRISYDNINIAPSGGASLCLEEINLLFEEVNHSIFETIIEEDFREALLLKEDGEESSSSDSSKDNNSSSSTTSSSNSSSSTSSSSTSAKTEEVKKTLFEKIKEFFGNIIEKIKNFVEGITSKFLQVIEADRKLYEKYKDILTMKNLEGFKGVEDCFDLDKYNSLDSSIKLDTVLDNMTKLENYAKKTGSENVEEIKKIKDDMVTLSENLEKSVSEIEDNKVTWKPSSDSDIKKVVNKLLNYNNDVMKKRIDNLKKLIKVTEELKSLYEKKIKAMDQEEVSDVKESGEAMISICGKLIGFFNKELSLRKSFYKDLRKRLIIMINYAKKDKSEKEENNEETKEENKQEENKQEESQENNKEEKKSSQQEAYQFLLAERSDMYIDNALNVSMSGLVEDSLNFTKIVNEAYNNIFKNIGITELREFVEVNNIALYEGARFDKIKETIINFFKTILDKIKKAYEAVIDKITEKTNEYYKKIGSNLKEIRPKEINDLTNEDIIKNIGTIYLYDLDFSNYYKIASKYGYSVYSKAYEFIRNDASDSQVSEYISKARPNYVRNCTGIDVSSVTDLTKKLIEKHQTKFSPGRGWIVKNWGNITDVVKGGNIKKQIKKSYDQEKRSIEKTLEEFKKLDGSENHARILQSCGALLKDICTLMNSINSVNIDLAVKEFKINYMVAFKIAKMLGKWNGAKS